MAHILENDLNILKITRNDQVAESLCKLYLNDTTTSDVYFMFYSSDSDGNETVDRLPAHRIILAAASSVFHQMFYGDLRKENDVLISDTTKDAFAEFLQFFLSERSGADR